MSVKPTHNIGSGPNKGSGVHSENTSLKSTGEKAKDAINEALKSNSELQAMLIDTGQKLVVQEEKVALEEKDAERRGANRMKECQRNLTLRIFLKALEIMAYMALGAFLYRRFYVIKG